MSKQLLIYDNVVPVSSEAHRDWSVSVEDHAFVSHMNSVPLVATEIPHAGGEYPVIFARNKNEGEYTPLAVMGLKEGQNLMLNDKNRLTTRYIPAFIRRYPFVFASDSKQENFTLCIDDTYKGWDKTGAKGDRLFDEQGEQSEMMKKLVDFLKDYQYRVELTRTFCDKLHQLDLLEPMEANVQFKGHENANLNLAGFYAVSREKLKKISDEAALDLFKRDGMELIYAHLQSMTNFNRLVDAMAKRLADEQAA
ncbi:SapC family protein [Marinimicrobium alkaliphilum]|uniref:SapC family protein n=1 Tax=Marinimicrobium alkaliphilum TaxID=2202654 RepID=UPI000DB96EF2|nr:SapC family protein [Marinimicrobium alkaliphilum]